MQLRGERTVRMELNDESLIELEAPSSARLDKAIPGAKWSTSRSIWLLPLSWAACTVAREVVVELEVGPRLTQWATEEYESRVLPASVSREATDGPEFKPAELGDPDDVVESGTEGYEEVRHAAQSYGSVEETAEKAWWWELWSGMPEFLNRDLSAKRTLMINFRSQADVEEFARLIGQRVGPRERSIWFPEAPIERETDWVFSDEDKPVTDGPLFPAQTQRLAKKRGGIAAAPKARKRGATPGQPDALSQLMDKLV